MNLNELIPDETYAQLYREGRLFKSITGKDLKAAIRKEMQKHITDFYKELVDSGNIKL